MAKDKIGDVHQACMKMMMDNKLVPGGDPGLSGGGMEQFRAREANLVTALLLNRVPGLNNTANVVFAAKDLGNLLRGSGIEVSEKQLLLLHEAEITKVIGERQQAVDQLKADQPKQIAAIGGHTATVSAERAQRQLTINVGLG